MMLAQEDTAGQKLLVRIKTQLPRLGASVLYLFGLR